MPASADTLPVCRACRSRRLVVAGTERYPYWQCPACGHVEVPTTQAARAGSGLRALLRRRRATGDADRLRPRYR